jgi:hypothetical protein
MLRAVITSPNYAYPPRSSSLAARQQHQPAAEWETCDPAPHEPCPPVGQEIHPAARPGPRPALAIAVLALISLALYVPGLRWGLPAMTSWSQDTIAGIRTLGAVAGWPDQWQGRYPPLHYLIVRAVYEPTLQWWQYTDAARYDAHTGALLFAPPHQEKIGLLMLIARVVSALMAFGAGVGIWAAARVLTKNNWAALLAGVILLCGAAWTYFAHLGNVDVPSIFWFTWSVYFFARAFESPAPKNALLLGLFGSLAISTKDSLAGVYPGMAIVLLIAEVQRWRLTQPWPAAIGRATFQSRWLIGLMAFALPYLLLNGVFHNPAAYVERMKYWLGITPDTLHAMQHRYDSQLSLLAASLWYAAGAVGWPMLIAMLVGIAHACRRHTRLALIVLIPALSYYVIVIARIDFVYSRFLFPMLALIGIVLAVALIDLWRSRCSIHLRLLLLAAVLIPTLTYSIAMNAEMVSDSRYAAEDWFRAHVEPTATVGAFSKPQYLPRLAEMGYATYAVDMSVASFDRPQPDYLVLTSYNYEDFNAEQKACMEALVRGKLGYELVATFRGRFLGVGSHWLSLAAWYAPTPGKISPTIIVLKRL